MTSIGLAHIPRDKIQSLDHTYPRETRSVVNLWTQEERETSSETTCQSLPKELNNTNFSVYCMKQCDFQSIQCGIQHTWNSLVVSSISEIDLKVGRNIG